MAACPRCARPVAVFGPRCLYCGAEVPPDALVPASEPESAPPPPERSLVVLDLQAAPARPLAQALGLSPLEAARRAERGGFHLLRIVAPADAEREAGRLAEAGLRAWLVTEAEVREAARPRLVQGGGWEDGALSLVAGGEPLRVAGADLVLVVRGPLAREYQSRPRGRTKLQTATLEPGLRVHLHRLSPGPPLEVDPADFEFTEPAETAGRSLIVVSSWVEKLRAQAPLDDEFRRMPPVLAPEAASGGALGIVRALRPARRRDAPLVLDNLAQFRFYSAWRAIVERRRRSPPG